MLSDDIPTLVSVKDELWAKKEEILSGWINTKEVISVLDRNNIDLFFFRDIYAAKILDYYFGVVNQTREIGDCPVMDDFLNMLKDHDISVDELFDIWTYARKSMVTVTFNMGIASKELFSDISYVFDLNFKSVLKDYSSIVYKLEKEVEIQIQKNKKKDELMFQQGRLAQMGEMISDIAHQWRQPLSMVSVIIQNIQLKYTLGKLEADFFHQNVDEIKKVLEQMSQTITDFQGFFKPNKKKEVFSIIDSITGALNLIKTDLSKSNIDVIRIHNHKEDSVSGYHNEFTQALLNILSNAKDAFVEQKNQQEKIIQIVTSIKSDKICLDIRDTAGGIDEEVIKKVFNPYFTTKEEGKGTGIGLYMTSQIVKNMQGSLYVENIISADNHKGAQFTIEFPIVLETVKPNLL